MSYVDLNLTEEETKLLMEGKINCICRPESFTGNDLSGKYIRVNDRLYRIIRGVWVIGNKKQYSLGFMGMYGDEE